MLSKEGAMSQKERPRYMTAQMKEDVEYDEEHLAAAKQLGIDTVSWGAWAVRKLDGLRVGFLRQASFTCRIIRSAP